VFGKAGKREAAIRGREKLFGEAMPSRFLGRKDEGERDRKGLAGGRQGKASGQSGLG